MNLAITLKNMTGPVYPMDGALIVGAAVALTLTLWNPSAQQQTSEQDHTQRCDQTKQAFAAATLPIEIRNQITALTFATGPACDLKPISLEVK